jgi:WD40 repeat protein
MLYAQIFRPAGDSAIVRIMVNSLASKTIATGLDASPVPGTLAVSPDGKSLYLALVGTGLPDNEARHDPNADRWLKIFDLDLATGARHPVAESAGEDNNDPAILGRNLYWTRNLIHMSIAFVPAVGGVARELAVGGQVPMWGPEGKSVAYSFGGWRLADWGLNLDAAEVDVDAEGRRGSQPVIIVSGYHEDFPPAWSPDGNWIAFHSHRSSKPVPEYSSPGSTDDIYLRRAGDVHAPEIRLTDFGWEAGPAYWSPDGQKLLFTSWQRGGQPGIDKLWVLTMDLESARALRAEMLPLTHEIRSVSWAAWSPDGKEIALEDNRGGQDRSIWLVRADGTHATRLLDYKGTTYEGLDWLPDGKTIIYSALAGDRLQLFSMPRTGGAPSQLAHDSGNLMHPRVSPDGKWIACTRLVQSKQIWRRPLP